MQCVLYTLQRGFKEHTACSDVTYISFSDHNFIQYSDDLIDPNSWQRIMKIKDLAKDSVVDESDEEINKEITEYDNNKFVSAGLCLIELHTLKKYYIYPIKIHNPIYNYILLSILLISIGYIAYVKCIFCNVKRKGTNNKVQLCSLLRICTMYFLYCLERGCKEQIAYVPYYLFSVQRGSKEGIVFSILAKEGSKRTLHVVMLPIYHVVTIIVSNIQM